MEASVVFLHKHFIAAEGSTRESFTELRSILQNLSATLSARRGSSSFQSNYGLTSAGYRTAQGMIVERGEQIRENIEAFEKRVEVLACEEVHDEATDQAAVLVTCRVRSDGIKLYILSNPRRTELRVGARPEGLV
jgi:predicted component of type VI protein secretion system